jgi:hypothetical protein
VAQIGLNHRLSVARTLREQMRALYESVLGASVKSPRMSKDFARYLRARRPDVSPGVAFASPRDVSGSLSSLFDQDGSQWDHRGAWRA